MKLKPQKETNFQFLNVTVTRKLAIGRAIATVLQRSLFSNLLVVFIAEKIILLLYKKKSLFKFGFVEHNSQQMRRSDTMLDSLVINRLF